MANAAKAPCSHPCCPKCCPQEKKEESCNPPDIMVCVRKKKGKEPKANAKKLKTCKSRELRGGILYVGCDCEKRNGLQDDCRRNECQGSPECITKPPSCCPSQYSNGKHLGKKKDQDGYGPDGSLTIEYDCFPALMSTQGECITLTKAK